MGEKVAAAGILGSKASLLAISAGPTGLFFNNIVGYPNQATVKSFDFNNILGHSQTLFLDRLFSITSWDISNYWASEPALHGDAPASRVKGSRLVKKQHLFHTKLLNRFNK